MFWKKAGAQRVNPATHIFSLCSGHVCLPSIIEASHMTKLKGVGRVGTALQRGRGRGVSVCYYYRGMKT